MPKLARDHRGVAAVEFALLMPIVMLLFLGFLDLAYLGRGHLRVQATASQIGQVISQCTSVGGDDEEVLMRLAERALGPFARTGKPWAAVVTAIGANNANQPSQAWRMDSRTALGTPRASPDFVPANPAPPSGMTLRSDQMLYRTEVFAVIDARIFTTASSVLAPLLGSANRIERVDSSVLHIARSADVTNLKTKTSSKACLS